MDQPEVVWVERVGLELGEMIGWPTLSRDFVGALENAQPIFTGKTFCSC